MKRAKPSHLSGATAVIPLVASARSGAGTTANFRHKFSVIWYRLYPQNNSSPASPDSDTVTCCLANWLTKKVGICDESANGSQYKPGKRGITSIACCGDTYNSVCSVPKCRATALARTASL